MQFIPEYDVFHWCNLCLLSSKLFIYMRISTFRLDYCVQWEHKIALDFLGSHFPIPQVRPNSLWQKRREEDRLGFPSSPVNAMQCEWISGLVTAQHMPELLTLQQQSRTQPMLLHAAGCWHILSHHRKCPIIFSALETSWGMDLTQVKLARMHTAELSVVNFAGSSPCAQIVQVNCVKSTTVLE